MKLCVFLVAITSMAYQRHHNQVAAFSLRMQSTMSTNLPPPLRSVASSPPPSTSTTRRFATASATPLDESKTTDAPSSDATSQKKTKTLGLLTFDLDDSLYPIEPVLHDANKVFVQTMANYGYSIEENDIVEAGKRVRAEAGPAGTAMSHTDVRLEAIRQEMERKMLERKLEECADDWATEVESLTTPIRRSAEKWAKTAVSQTVVESIYSAWERERHHSAERHLYPEIIEALQNIKEEHPNVVIGAVTDGKANPMLMVFSLAPFFDFCMSWEDDAEGRMEFFQELGNVHGNADLQWIYAAAYDKYKEIAQAKLEMKKSSDGQVSVSEDDEADQPIWMHVGDDLAYDVGGSASCGAKTILLDLDEEYGQTAKVRFGPNANMPSWSTASSEEIVNRKAMNDAAEGMVDRRVSRLTMLPDAVDDILKGE